MKLLAVLTQSPFEKSTGVSIAAKRHLEQLSAKHVIDVIYPSQKAASPRLDSHPGLTINVVAAHPRHLRQLRQLLLLVAGKPLSVSAAASQDMKQAVANALSSTHFDAILIYGIGGIQFIPAHYYNITIANIEDPQTLRTQRLRALPTLSFLERLRLIVYQLINHRYEYKILPALYKAVVFSPSDAGELQALLPESHAGFVHYGVDTTPDDRIVPHAHRRKNTILFSGTMSHPANIDGALYFIQKIFPLILQEEPSAKLWIVGSNPSRKIYSAARLLSDNVKITGRVDDIGNYIREATVSICPVRLPIGVQTKILEAMSWGTPVVSTPEGNKGIVATAGESILIAETPEAFAHNVIALLNGDRWQRISQHGLEYSRSQFSWEHSVTDMEVLINEIRLSQL